MTDDLGKVRVHQCPCGRLTVRSTKPPPWSAMTEAEYRTSFSECHGCGLSIDWSLAPVHDHKLFVEELLQRLKK